MKALFEIPASPLVPVEGEEAGYPVHRIFCVGRNYAAHAAEMGAEVDREEPFYFTKPASAIVLSGTEIPYPPGTSNLHHEMELVVAIGAPLFRAGTEEAAKAVYGFACGLDMTRRDLQQAARVKQRPWDLGKAFENSAVIGRITKAATFAGIGDQRIWLKVGEELRQDARLSELAWSVPELISHLSWYYHLRQGDLLYTGTPAGVGPVVAGDRITGGIDGLEPIELSIGPAE
ncbi:fumarylpyruvate hydrolase [Ciceribacter lividus]|uniref:Fumarylpyruvate hydrolase n=1 Tax=Ciceribacter lividus TaxID=1197950 RepID=A0A6I7HK72_9HYPH|nr:fumarylacetoacetate hydrolase family protein [Ciceribacter lividus]RCW21990.1 fumarylpyruvate hydrolase [Ciceribacter lividus]